MGGEKKVGWDEEEEEGKNGWKITNAAVKWDACTHLTPDPHTR